MNNKSKKLASNTLYQLLYVHTRIWLTSVPTHCTNYSMYTKVRLTSVPTYCTNYSLHTRVGLTSVPHLMEGDVELLKIKFMLHRK